MPLETANFIPDLVPSNPAASDGMSQGDDHIRLLKAVIKATFPNFTDVALGSTQAQLDAAVAAAVTNGVSVLADAGVNFKTNTGDKITNPAAGEIDVLGARFVKAAGVTSLTLDGALTTPTINGPGIIPIGGMIMWLDDNLPNTGGVWCWANGGTLSRTTAGAGLELFNEWSRNSGNPLRYGAGDGSTTFNVINMQEAAPVGKSTMGGASSPGLLASISAGLKAVLGGIWGSDTSQLTTANLPPYTPSGSVTTTINVTPAGNSFMVSGSGNNVGVGGANTGGSLQAPPTATSSFSGNAQGGTQTPFNNTMPSRAVNFIIRIA